MTSLNIVIVEKNASLKSLQIKDFKEEELFKKCGFNKGEDFLNWDGKTASWETEKWDDDKTHTEDKF